MTTRKKTIPEKPKTILIKPREVFRKELIDRIEIGNQTLLRQIKTMEQLTQLNHDIANWDDFNEELIKRAFNNQNNEYHYKYIQVNQMMGIMDYARGVNVNSFEYKLSEAKQKITNCLTILNRLVDKLPLIDQDGAIFPYQTAVRNFYNCGFIVHGHNDSIKFEVARYIEKEIKRKVIILHEEPNKGQTIIEKFENNSTVDFAITIWTADDIGKAKEATDYQNRARQNVVFETGFFIGALGRQNVVVLVEDGVEIPSDYSGVIFISLAGNWKHDLRKEIEAIYAL